MAIFWSLFVKKILYFVLFLSLLFLQAFANEEKLTQENLIQTRVDEIGTRILNSNKITKRIIFVYDKDKKKSILDLRETLNKRQVIVYDFLYKSAQTDDEVTAMLAREISLALKSYDGDWGGRIDSLQVAASSKKFEIVADKRAVDFMVKAGYNPLALIVYINKTCPQKRSDFISRSNLTSKRLANIYEYITYKYPSFLQNNEYMDNIYYQNFLLTSVQNRAKLKEKIKTRCKQAIKYE